VFWAQRGVLAYGFCVGVMGLLKFGGFQIIAWRKAWWAIENEWSVQFEERAKSGINAHACSLNFPASQNRQ